MFDIEYKGGNTVVVTTKQTKLVFDPKQSLIGLSDLVQLDAVQLVTESRFMVESDKYKLLFDGPGEYEVGDVSIRGVAARRHIDGDDAVPESTIYRLAIGEVKIVIVGNIATPLSEDQLEMIGLVDIAVLPVGGGGYTLDATSAAGLLRQLEPKMVVPVHYADKALKYEVPQDTLETFTGELGVQVEEAGDKYRLKASSSLPQVLTVTKINLS